MKFLADENVEKPLVDFLRNQGHDVLYVSETTRRGIDERLLQRANSESRILITNDKDFGELVYFQKKMSCGLACRPTPAIRKPVKSMTPAPKRNFRSLTSHG